MFEPTTIRTLRTALPAVAAATVLGLGLAGCAQTGDEYGATEDEADRYAAEDTGAAGEEGYGGETPTMPDETATMPDETGTLGEPGMESEVAELEIAAVTGDPDAWFERSVTAEVEVSDREPTDRGFWVEQDGQEMLAVLIDRPEEMPMDIQGGQRLRLSEATLKDPATADRLPGAALDQDTLRLIEQEEVFLLVDRDAIEVLEDGAVRRGG